jgi:hypothetical protein
MRLYPARAALMIDDAEDLSESTTTRIAGGLDFTAIGGKRQQREVPQSLRVKPGAKHPVWKTQSIESSIIRTSDWRTRFTASPYGQFHRLASTFFSSSIFFC